MTLREAATSLAARVPTQVKLLFATLAYYAVICVVFWQVENWPVLPTQAMSMDERLSQARHSKGAPSLTSLTSPRVLRPEDI